MVRSKPSLPTTAGRASLWPCRTRTTSRRHAPGSRHRQREPETGARSERALDAYSTTVLLNQVLHDAEPEAEAARSGLLGAHPGAEDPLLIFGRNAWSVIGNAHSYVRAERREMHFDLVAFDRVAAGIGQQVGDHLDNAAGIGRHACCSSGEADFLTALFEQTVDEQHRALDALAQVDRPRARLERACLNGGGAGQVLRQALKPA